MKKLLTKKIDCEDVWSAVKKIKFKKEITIEHSLPADTNEISIYVGSGNDDEDVFITLDKNQAIKVIKVLSKIIAKRMF